MVIADTTNNLLPSIIIVILLGFVAYAVLSSLFQKARLEKLKKARDMIKDRHERMRIAEWRVKRENEKKNNK